MPSDPEKRGQGKPPNQVEYRVAVPANARIRRITIELSDPASAPAKTSLRQVNQLSPHFTRFMNGIREVTTVWAGQNHDSGKLGNDTVYEKALNSSLRPAVFAAIKEVQMGGAEDFFAASLARSRQLLHGIQDLPQEDPNLSAWFETLEGHFSQAVTDFQEGRAGK